MSRTNQSRPNELPVFAARSSTGSDTARAKMPIAVTCRGHTAASTGLHAVNIPMPDANNPMIVPARPAAGNQSR
jgi:hypothetical protein